VRPGRDMGAMLEMAARNELLRRAGKHSARELLARLEENAGLAPEIALEPQSESILNAPVSLRAAPPPPNSSLAQPDPAWSDDSEHPGGIHRNYPERSNESSAWIPAVKRRDE